MKSNQIIKYIGLACLVITGLMILGGVIGLLTGEFLNVKRFSNFFWFANSFALFGILCMTTFFAFKNKDQE